MDIPNKAFTHGGKFHSDDVFGAALLTYLNADIIIERGYNVPDDYDGIIFDIGFGEYDHHQQNALIRENGVPYAAFGLLWKQFGTEILGAEDAKRFDEKFIQSLDLSDNTGCYNEIAEIISLYNPNWDETISVEDAFESAKQWAMTILKRYFARVESINKAEKIIRPDLDKQKNGIAILTHFVPWKKCVKNTDIKFVIYHSQRGGFCAQAVESEEEDEDGRHKLKCPFPQEWRGKEMGILQEITGIEGIKFCHNSGFLISTNTIDEAILACQKAMKLYM